MRLLMTALDALSDVEFYGTALFLVGAALALAVLAVERDGRASRRVDRGFQVGGRR